MKIKIADEFDENPICEDILKVSQFINSINWDSLSQNLKSHPAGLAGHLGKLVSSDLFEYGQKNIAQQYKNIELLKTVKCKDWIQERNVVFQSFLENCANIHNNRDVSEKKYNAVAHCIEQILYARKKNHITPFAFKRNLVTYSITISKEITTMNCKWEGCGSSRTVSDVICEKSPPTPCPDGDIINMIDNNQKVGIHSGCIKEGSKVPLSICTTMCHILPQPTTEIQYNPNLSPENWINKSSSNDIIEKVALLEKQSLKEFQRYKGLFVEETLKIVLSEQFTDFIRNDYIDIAIANQGKINTCSSCYHTYAKDVGICPHCKLDANYYDHDFDPYYRTASKHSDIKPIVYIGEPCMTNPKSIDSIREVLQHVDLTNNLKKEDNCRQWTFLISDGVPYIYASLLKYVEKK